MNDTAQQAIASARAAYGHIPGRSDVEVLALSVSQLTRKNKELLGDADFFRARARSFEVQLDSDS